MPKLSLYNSLTRRKEEFEPINPPNVGLYTCGMTVYDYAHIGHTRKYVGDDTLRRTLTYLGFEVSHVQNVTDVGHLVSDEDKGEDKMEKGARKQGKTVWEIAEFFTEDFFQTMDKMNVLRPDVICKATGHIAEQIELVRKLLDNKHAYETPEAIYFDVSSFIGYESILGQKMDDKQTAVRDEVQAGKYKKHPADFALWFKCVGRFENHVQHWNSPWGEGFPGWHIECSAMCLKYLDNVYGEDGKIYPERSHGIDIHTGGIDHIPVHHPNEIAQAEGAIGSKFVNFWVHHGWLLVDGEKMSKSIGNSYRLEDVEKKNFSPMDLRYLFLGTHYRKQLNFTWEALGSAHNAYEKARQIVREIIANPTDIGHEEKPKTIETKPSNSSHAPSKPIREQKSKTETDYQNDLDQALTDDLNTPQVLATLWELLRDEHLSNQAKLNLILLIDDVLGINLTAPVTRTQTQVTPEIIELAQTRQQFRESKQFEQADALRKKIESQGYIIKDTPDSYTITPKLLD